MNLAQLTQNIPELIRITRGAETEIAFLTADSRKKGENGLFFCLPGARFDGHDFAPQAVEKGASALVVERELRDEVLNAIYKGMGMAKKAKGIAFSLPVSDVAGLAPVPAAEEAQV